MGKFMKVLKVAGDVAEIIVASSIVVELIERYRAKKARGSKLGNPEHLLNKHCEAVANSNRTNREKARINPNNKRAVAFLKVLVTQEYTYLKMAETLNREGFVTSQGFQFTPSTVYKLIKRYNLR